MSQELVFLCIFLYQAVACLVYLQLDSSDDNDASLPLSLKNPYRFLAALFWPVFFLLVALVVLIAWWASRVIERSKR